MVWMTSGRNVAPLNETFTLSRYASLWRKSIMHLRPWVVKVLSDESACPHTMLYCFKMDHGVFRQDPTLFEYPTSQHVMLHVLHEACTQGPQTFFHHLAKDEGEIGAFFQRYYTIIQYAPVSSIRQWRNTGSLSFFYDVVSC